MSVSYPAAARIEEALAYIANPPSSTDPHSDQYCYAPTDYGLHVCGLHPDGENFQTVVNLPVGTAAEARALFEAGKEACATGVACSGDLVVDLCLHGSIEEDFSITRQMLEPLVRLWAAGA